jgi:hypothetical protein
VRITGSFRLDGTLNGRHFPDGLVAALRDRRQGLHRKDTEDQYDRKTDTSGGDDLHSAPWQFGAFRVADKRVIKPTTQYRTGQYASVSRYKPPLVAIEKRGPVIIRESYETRETR